MSPPALSELSDPFVVRLLQLLRDQGPATGLLEHLEDELTVQGSEPNEVLRREQGRQAANQVTVGNCVLSLRLLSAVDWNAFFEQTSHVEAILRDDPSGVYPRQDFATSDRYRRAVEMIARGSKADEIDVARHAVALAGRGHGSSEPLDHVGFYLIDRGQKRAEGRLWVSPGLARAPAGVGPWPAGMGLFRVDHALARQPDGAGRGCSRWEAPAFRGGSPYLPRCC